MCSVRYHKYSESYMANRMTTYAYKCNVFEKHMCKQRDAHLYTFVCVDDNHLHSFHLIRVYVFLFIIGWPLKSLKIDWHSPTQIADSL